MKKLTLDLEQLAVESFDTGAGRRSGTIRGHSGVSDTTCIQIICDCPTGSGDTCDAACTGETSVETGCHQPTVNDHTCQRPSCYNSCPGTCGEITCSPLEC